MQLQALLLSLASVVLAGSTVNTVSATSLVSCNPLSATTCAADKALATSLVDDFKEASDYYLPYRTPTEIYYGDDGLTLTLAKRYDNPSLVSDFYIMFGKIEVVLKAASGQGIISSFYLQSDDLDEIDLEWFGGDASQVQTNYFAKGDTTTYDRGGYHNMADPRADYHNYTIEWNQNALSWYVDGINVRTLLSSDPRGYPQSPMRLYFGIWAGGDPTNNEGTIEWAGGETDYTQVPFSMYIKNLVVSDYSSGSEYSYSDQTGSWKSISSLGGSINGRKAIADAEFERLVSGNTVVSLNQAGSGSVSQSSTSSTSLSSTTPQASNTLNQTTSTASDRGETTSTSSQTRRTSAQTASTTSQTRRTSAQTTSTTSSTLETSTRTTRTTSRSTTSSLASSSSSSSADSVSVLTNGGNVIVKSSSLAAFFLFMCSLI